jgi:1,4-alpha-glucan branching enzyme
MKTFQHSKISIPEKFYFNLMNNIDEKPANGMHSAHNSFKVMNFYCFAPMANAVQLAGDFNHWHPVLMNHRDGGWWYIQARLPHGHHQYRFLVDGRPVLDSHAIGTARDMDGKPVSLIAVS